MNNWLEAMTNPKGAMIRNYMLQILGQERFLKHQAFIDRLSATLPTTSDIKELGEICVSLYESGYQTAINDCKEKFEKLGYNVSINRKQIEAGSR